MILSDFNNAHAHTLISEDVDINIYPKLDPDHNVGKGGEVFEIGDLHGNALKLLYTLVRHGIVNITEENYNKFVKIYYTNLKELNKTQLDILINEYHKILESIQVVENHNSTGLLLIGDETLDRGQNDYYTLKLFEKLQAGNFPFPLEILISNHGELFFADYENGRPFSDGGMMVGQGNSAEMLQFLIDNECVKKEEVFEIIDKYYTPHVKVLSYTLNETKDKIKISSHAAIGPDNIEQITIALDKLGYSCKYNAGSALELAQTIEDINAAFSEISRKKGISALMFGDTLSYNRCYMSELPNGDPKQALANTFYFSLDGKYVVRDPKGTVQEGSTTTINLETLKERNYTLALMSDLPNKDPKQAENDKLYLSSDGKYVVRDINYGVQEDVLPRSSGINLEGLENKLNDPTLLKNILEITALRGHTKHKLFMMKGTWALQDSLASKGHAFPRFPWEQINKSDYKEHPFAAFLWNRKYDTLNRSSLSFVTWVHGHDSSLKSQPENNFYNLDNNLGKLDDVNGEYGWHNKDKYTLLCSPNITLNTKKRKRFSNK